MLRSGVPALNRSWAYRSSRGDRNKVAFFRKSPPVTDLIDRARQVFQGFTPDDSYFTTVLTPFLADLCAALKVRRFETVAEFEAITEPLKTMPPVRAVLCAGSVLHSAGKLFLQAPGGEQLANFVASGGLSQAWRAFRLVDDKTTAQWMIASMDVLWRYEPPPFRELDHAQVVYVSGHFALVTGEGRDVLRTRWHEALQSLGDVHPEAADTAESRELIASSKQHLGRSWSDQLAELGL
jgi:hypothetical protein